MWYTMPDKIGKLVDQALNKAWDPKEEDPKTIVRNMVKWGNFLSVWKFYSMFYFQYLLTIPVVNS